ncbi:MAG TPA: hypothetical protein VMU45_12470 [Candidatus Eisenbacteria bacterium]|nr:hypothetical protein [Candidatus Eisenbacteria bacterium]
MGRTFSWFLLLASCSVFAVAQGYNPLPKLVVHARYVFVTTNAGGDLTNPHVMPDDRQAVVEVQKAITKWGRYALAYQEKDADLILLVRKGRWAESLPGVRVGAGSNTKPGIGADVPTDAGDPRDMLALYDAAAGVDSAPLWRDLMKGGLNPPQMALIVELRRAVDAAASVP